MLEDYRAGLTGIQIDSGHHMSEEAPEEVVSALTTFLILRPQT
jgi:hypothetical protein